MDQTSYRLTGGGTVQARTVAEAIEAAQLAKLAAGTSGPADDPAFRDWAAKRCRALGVDPEDASITELTAIAPTRADGVRTGATGIPFLMVKAARGAAGAPRRVAPPQASALVGLVVKTEAEQRFTLTVAYPAGRADSSTALDNHRDFASKAVVEAAAWTYLRDHRQIGLWHQDGTEGAGTVVESYVWPDGAPEWTVKAGTGEYTVKPGDWLLGVQWTPEAWQLIKSGQVGGLSIQGRAARARPTGEAIAALRKAQIAARERDGHLAKAAAAQAQAGQLTDPGTREQLAQRARSERELAVSPAGHLAKAARYEDLAAAVTDPATRQGYLELAASERRKASTR
jgi:hypothetical protein